MSPHSGFHPVQNPKNQSQLPALAGSPREDSAGYWQHGELGEHQKKGSAFAYRVREVMSEAG